MKTLDSITRDVKILCGNVFIDGSLMVPERSLGLIIFAHGSGSSRFSPRNNLVARFLNQGGFATLLLDLLLPEEDQDLENRFNIQLLSIRLAAAGDWAKKAESTKNLPIGLFGASTGAAAALQWAGDIQNKDRNEIFAIVSRGGRPDLTKPLCLEAVKAPTLLIVGQRDEAVIAYNEKAYQRMKCQKSIQIVPGATHLFEEPGAMDLVSKLAFNWFKKNLLLRQ